MKVCPECYSDSYERTTSTALRVIGSLVLIFIIPFGFFFAWIPFVISHKFSCLVCGYEDKEDNLVEMDWRELESLRRKQIQLEDRLAPFMNHWIVDEARILYKVVSAKGQFLLIEINNKAISALRITEFSVEKNKILVDDLVSDNFRIIYYDMEKEIRLMEFGKTVITDKELKALQDTREQGHTELANWLHAEGLLKGYITVEQIERSSNKD